MKSRLVAACLLSLCASLGAQAQEYRFTYSKLYSPLKQNLKPGHDQVKVGLFFTNFDTKQPCSIEKAWMEKEEHYEELTISDNGEVNVPVDTNLKSANPLVYIHTEQDARCDYSWVVLSRSPLSGTVSQTQLTELTDQMGLLLGDLGGMFSSWFAPDIDGVTLEFKANTLSHIQLSNGKMIEISDEGRALLKLTDLDNGVEARLPQVTQRVMPYIQQ